MSERKEPPKRKRVLQIAALVADDDAFEEYLKERERKTELLTVLMKCAEEIVTNGGTDVEYEAAVTKGVENYITHTVPRLTDSQFREHFRMTRTTAEILAQATAATMDTAASTSTPVMTKVLLTLWVLSNEGSYREVGNLFGCNKGVAFYIVRETVRVWTELALKEITWPDDLQAVAVRFEEKWGFPGVVGAVDGCHIAIKCPEVEQSAYYNRKDFHSVILQGCCDDNLVFTHVYVCSPGRLHDARVYANSGLEDILEALPPNFHILGDSAYPLRTYLIRPFQDNGRLSAEQELFNKKLSTSRSVIERTFGRLKGKFRVLKHLDMSSRDLILRFIMSACWLHNVIIKHEQDIDGDSSEEEDEDQAEGDVELRREYCTDVYSEDDRNAAFKRNRIMSEIC